MEIVKVELNLKEVNKEVAVFNCEKKVSGVIHTTEDGKTTVVLDGGYVLGKFNCPHCAVTEISMLEYRKAMRAIANGFDTGEWPAPITDDYTDELNDFDLRRLEALRTQA